LTTFGTANPLVIYAFVGVTRARVPCVEAIEGLHGHMTVAGRSLAYSVTVASLSRTNSCSSSSSSNGQLHTHTHTHRDVLVVPLETRTG